MFLQWLPMRPLPLAHYFRPSGVSSLRHYASPPGKNRRTGKTIPSAVPTRRQPHATSYTKMIKISELTEAQKQALGTPGVLRRGRLERLDQSRCLTVSNMPLFAIEADIRQFFEESSFKVEQIVMCFDHVAQNGAICHVLLKDSSQIQSAITTLNGEYLFDRAVTVKVPKTLERNTPLTFGAERGWHATPNPSIWQSKLREVFWEPPKDMFAALRESRRVIIENMPLLAFRSTDLNLIAIRIYELFHDFNVLNYSRAFRYNPRISHLSGAGMTLDFATAEEAKVAIQTRNGEKILGYSIQLAISKPPLSLTNPWDTTRGSGHNRPRDQGSAVATNFEEMQEEMYRKWILKGKDRKLWIPSHSYR